MSGAAFLGLVRVAEVLQRDLDRDLRAAHGLGLGAFEVLLHLGSFSPDGSLPMRQLVGQLSLSQSRISRLVAELEREGLVTREAFVGDSRSVVVRITDAGLQLIAPASQTHLAGLERRLFAPLDDADVDDLVRLTRLVLGDEAPRTGRPRRPVPAEPAGDQVAENSA